MIVDDCKQLCELFTFCLFSHVSRVDNKVAHCLAKHPVEIELSVWIEDAPFDVLNLALLDVLSSVN